MKSLNLHKLIQSIRVERGIILLVLLVLVVIGAVPGYWTGNWSWAQLPNIPNLNQIRSLRDTGLELPDWQTVEQQTVTIGGRRWSYQEMKGDYPRPVFLLLMPPSDHKAQPQVEWVDINNITQWRTDSYDQIQFDGVKARFFRAWTQQQTFAVVQWYAWPQGGHPAPNRWFWADQLAQLRRDRVPWVAVCLQIPMEPLGDLQASRPLAESLSKIVQAALITGPFAGAESAS